MEDANVMTDDQLREKLHHFGEPVGPITATTRRLLEKKLEFYLTGKKSGDQVKDQSQGDCNAANGHTDCSNGQSEAEDISPAPRTFYGVALPADMECVDQGK